MTTPPKAWTAPGPGRWEQDIAHQSAPFSHYAMRLLERYFCRGIIDAAVRYGLPLRDLTLADVDGWFYLRTDFADDEAGMMRAEAAATEALATEAWRRDAETWYSSERQSLRSRLLALQAVDVSALSDAELATRLATLEAIAAEGWCIHFRNAVAHWVGVGRWVAFVTGCVDQAPSDALKILRGASPTSLDTIAYVDRLARAVQASPAAIQALASSLEDHEVLRMLAAASTDVAAAIDAYLQEHGSRTFTGFDLLDRTTIEAPGALLGNIRARLGAGTQPSSDSSGGDELRARVPEDQRAQYDALFDSARLLYGVRDDDVGITFHWPMGLLRLSLLEAGRRLHQGLVLADPGAVFDATPEEVIALLRGEGRVSNEVLADRARQRLDPANASAPPALGDPPSDLPPPDALPPALGQVMGAFLMAQSLENAPPPEQLRQDSVEGLAASHGSYQGRACVVAGASDFQRIRPGDVLVAPFTTPAYNVVLPMIGAVVTDYGGVLSHAAIVAREYGIPAVVATGVGTSRIQDGRQVRVDGTTGRVTLM